MKTKEILNILSRIKPGIAKKEIVEQSTHFIFIDNNILTYNDFICISHECEHDIFGSVKAADFYKIINSIDEEEFEIIQNKDSIKVESFSTKAELAFLTGKETEVLAKIKTLNLDNMKFKSLPKDFLEAMSLCLFSASKDATSLYLQCINIQEDHIMSSDNYRISYFQLENLMKDTFLIPLDAAIELVKFDIVKYAISDSWLHFSTDDGVIFSARRYEAEYKEGYEKFFDVQGIVLELNSTLKPALDTLASLCESDLDLDKTIDVTISKNQIKLKAKKETGWIEKIFVIPTPIKKKQETIQFTINPIFFSQILSKSTTMILSENSAMFQNDKFKHVIGL